MSREVYSGWSVDRFRKGHDQPKRKENKKAIVSAAPSGSSPR